MHNEIQPFTLSNANVLITVGFIIPKFYFVGVLILIGAIVYGASVSQGKAPLPHKPVGDVQYVLSWSFALSIIAAILFVISGVIMGFARKPRMIE